MTILITVAFWIIWANVAWFSIGFPITATILTSLILIARIIKAANKANQSSQVPDFFPSWMKK